MKVIINACFQAILLLLFAMAGFLLAPRMLDVYDQWFPPSAFVSGDFRALYTETGKPVVVFTTSTCPYCKKTREFLESKNVNFADLVIDKAAPAEKRFHELGESSVPVLFIGNRKIIGFRERAITEALDMVPK